MAKKKVTFEEAMERLEAIVEQLEQEERTRLSPRACLAAESRGDIFVEDDSREVFWSIRCESGNVQHLSLLNTDWSEKGNVKAVTVHTPGVVADVEVKERNAALLTVLPFALLETGNEHFIEVLTCSQSSARIRIHGRGQGRLTVYRNGRVEQTEFSISDIFTDMEL